MSEQDILNQIAAEAEPGFAGTNDYEKRRERESSNILPVYKVWNPNIKWNAARDGEQPITPGMVMNTTYFENDEPKKEREIVDKVIAVILYTSHGRKLETGQGQSFRTICSSHDGQTPSARIDEPLCRQSTTQDLVRIMSGWRGMDQAKIDARIKEVTNDAGQLMVCGLKASNGTIELCPYAKRNAVTNKQGDCKPHIYVQAYDIKKERQFKMELTGKAIWNGKFIAPFHEFFQYLRKASPQTGGLPCYAFVVELSAATDGSTYYLNVTNWKPISQLENRNKMKELALKAREGYEKQATRLSKKEYDRVKALKEQEKKASEPAVAVTKPVEAQKVDTKPAPHIPFDPPTPVSSPAPVVPVSFEEDDIPF